MATKTKAKPDENEILKYEIAEEIGLIDKVSKTGWKSLTARESGRIGGLMAKRKKEQQQKEQLLFQSCALDPLPSGKQN